MKLKSFMQWVANPLYFFLGLASLVPFALVLIYVASYRLIVPFGDEWFMNGRVAIATVEKHLTLGDLLFVNGGHRTLFTNLATAVSTLLTHWDLRVESLISPVLSFVCFVLLIRMFRKAERRATLVVLVPFSLILFSLYRDYNWWSLRHSHWYFANFFVLLTLYALNQERLSKIKLALAIVLGWCATFSMATGMLVWPLGLMLLWFQGRRSWRLYVTWIFFGSISVILYFINSGIFSFVSASDVYANNAAQQLSVNSPIGLNLVAFLLRFIGASVLSESSVSEAIAVVGALGLSLFAINAFFLWRADRGVKRLAPWLAVGGFSIGSGVLTAIGRANSLGIDRALTVQYIVGSEFFWVALVALMVMVILQHAHSFSLGIPLRLISSANVVLSAVCLGLYGYSTVSSLQDQSIIWEHGLRLTANPKLMPDEQCVLSFIYTRETDCFTRIMLGLPSNTRALDRLAAGNLTIFSHYPTVSMLPNAYHAGSPLVLASSNIWTNIHMRDRLLNTVAESQIFHLVQSSEHLDEVTQLLNPPVRISVGSSEPSPAFDAQLADSDQVWIVEDASAPGLTSGYTHRLEARGYTSIYSSIVTEPARFSLAGYQRLSARPQPQFRLGDYFTLEGWTLGQSVDVEPCEAVTLQTLWSVDAGIPLDYSLTAVIAGSDGVGVARSDGAPADLKTTFWKADQYYMDRRNITIPCALPKADYNLLLGLYNYRTSVSLPATTVDGNPVSNLIYLTTLHVR